jgi:hypothetical protein
MDVTHKTAVDAFITGLVTDGLFSLCDAQYLLCQDTAGNAALNLQSSSFTLTVNGSPTFTANSGYVGGSTSNLDTGYNASTAGGNLTQNSASVFAWTLANFVGGTDYGCMLGQNLASPTIDMYPHYTDNTFYSQITSTNGSTPQTATGHFYGVSRTSSSVVATYVDTTSNTSSPVSTALSNTNILLLNDGAGSGSNSRPFTANLAYAWIGAGLNSTQQGNLYTRVHTYMHTIGGAP